jgi:hypothetical protein
MVPVFSSAITYAVLLPQFDFSVYKLIFIGVITIFAITLAIRVKEKILLDWLLLITKYNLRPKLYLFNKNDSMFRKVEVPLQASKVPLPKAKESQEKIAITPIITENLKPFIELEYALATQSLSFKVREKGGYNVFVE